MNSKQTSAWRVIGVDCATDPRKVGLAKVDWLNDAWWLVEAQTCSLRGRPADVAAEWIGASASVLIALDAPLGWPALMGQLSEHNAGDPIPTSANAFFRRTTDLFVKEKTFKTPLDVGADRIARTAHWALGFLRDLRQSTGLVIPLAWKPDPGPGIHAIEVYPAATLLAHGADLKGYKAQAGRIERTAILEVLSQRLRCSEPFQQCIDSADALDAAVCALAGADFLDGCAVPPVNEELALKEGWIWFKERDSKMP